MQHRLYKYFSRSEHAELFLEGKIFFRTLEYFISFEDDQIRGDPDEGTHIYRPTTGLRLDMADGRTVPLRGSEFRSSVVTGSIYVFCMSTCYSEGLAKEFESVACVEVHSKRDLLQRVRSKLEESGEQVFMGPVTYRDPSMPPLHIWALPEKICMTKSPNFTRQSEYRIVLGKPRVFVPENVTTMIVPHGYKGAFNQTSVESSVIEIGSIREFCVLRPKLAL